MKELIIYGAGDFGEELLWYIEEINKKEPKWKVLGFLDDGLEKGTKVDGFCVLGGAEFLDTYEKPIDVVCSINLPDVKKKIIEKLKKNKNISFPSIIYPTAQIAPSAKIGEGALIGPSAVVSIKCKVGDFVTIKQLASVGHHSNVGDYTLVAPCCALGGHVKIGNMVDMGIGASFRLLSKVGDEVILGAGAVVTKDIPPRCTAVGVPAKPIKFRGE